MELYFHSPNTPSWSGAQLKHRDIFTFYILLLIQFEGTHYCRFKVPQREFVMCLSKCSHSL